MKKPISPTLHSSLDYVFGSVLMTAPVALGLDRKLVKNYATLAAGIGSMNAMTDTPAGIKRVLPLRVHKYMDLAVLGGLAIAAGSRSVRSDKKAMSFHMAFMGLSLVQFILTDFNAGKNRKIPLRKVDYCYG
ncbi:MAG TPA: hypothetical protein VGB43_08895 [Flavobacterium sp.]|jgi:hypothetical protein